MDLRSTEYTRPARGILRNGAIRLTLTAVLGLAILALPLVSVTQTGSRMDAVSGSMEWQTTWPLGITSGPRITPSPLEHRLTQLGIPWTRRWELLHNTHRRLFGTATCYECGLAPPIYQLKPVLPRYAETATTAELRTFIGVMQNGTDAQQKAAVQAAIDNVLR